MYWVLPKSVPPCTKSMPELKIGETATFWVTVLPFDSTCRGSRVALAAAITIRIGTRYAVTVVVVFVDEGSVPTIVNGSPAAVPFQLWSPVGAGATSLFK